LVLPHRGINKDSRLKDKDKDQYKYFTVKDKDEDQGHEFKDRNQTLLT